MKDADHTAADFARSYEAFLPDLSDPDVVVPPRSDPSWGEVLQPLADIRAQYRVPPRSDGHDEGLGR